MERRFILTTCLLLAAAAGTLAGHWSVNPHAFQYDMTAYVQVTSATGGVLRQADYEVAAFSGDECRGVGKLLTAGDGTQLFQLRIRSNEAGGEEIRFRAYQTATAKELYPEATLTFVAQAVAGTPGDPLLLAVDTDLRGDANGDGVVNIADVTALINYINGQEPATFCREAADVNSDGSINIADVTGVINIINQQLRS